MALLNSLIDCNIFSIDLFRSCALYSNVICASWFFFSLILVRFTSSLPPPIFRQLPLSVLSLLPPPLLLLNDCTKASIPVLNRSGDNGDLFSWSQWNAFDSSPLSTMFAVELLNSR